MNRKSTVSLRLGLVLGLCLVVFQMAGYAADAQRGGSTPGAATAESFTPQPYLSTGFPQVVVVSGTDYEMGVQYGEQTGAAIAHNVALFKSRLYDAHGAAVITKDMQVWDYYLTKYDPAYKDWLKGTVEGCKQEGYDVSYLDLVGLMVYPTEFWAKPKTPYPAETRIAFVETPPAAIPKEAYHSCNTFAATGSKTRDGKPIHAITSMVATEAMDSVILLAFPKEGASFVSQTYAGRVNSNYAMNSKGFTWTMTAIMSDTPAWGVPPEVYFHYLAQVAASPAEALEYLKSTPKGGVTGGFILSDASGTISVFEGTADHFHLGHPGDRGEPGGQFVVQTNHLIDPSLAAYNPKWLSVIGTYARYDTVFQTLKDAAPGTVDFSFSKNLFASDDWYEAGKAAWHRNTPGVREISNSHTSVSQGIFFPADLIAYLETGTPSGRGLPAFATGEYVKIKLATDPKKVTYQADKDALALYWDASDSFERDLNAKAPFLTTPIANDIRDKLNQAFAAYSLGMDRASFANLTTDAKNRIGLWADAMTYYARAQLPSPNGQNSITESQGRRPLDGRAPKHSNERQEPISLGAFLRPLSFFDIIGRRERKARRTRERSSRRETKSFGDEMLPIWLPAKV